MGARITEVQALFKGLYHLEDGFKSDGSQFDRLFNDGDTFSIGELSCCILKLWTHSSLYHQPRSRFH